MGPITVWAVTGGIVVAGVILATGIYNRLVRMRNQCNNAFAQIEVQLKRRYDLIPNLVECVKGYMTHERECLVKVAEARNQAAAELSTATQQPGDDAALQRWIGAEGALARALGRMSAVMESYPELKANAAVADLTEQLTSTENRVAYARQAYNDWATGFNDYKETFPACLVAPLFGLRQSRKLIEFADREQIAEPPRVALV
jgi:LemA protein